MSSSFDAEIRARTYPSTVIVLENPFPSERLRQAVRDVLETRHNDRLGPKYVAYSPPISRLHP